MSESLDPHAVNSLIPGDADPVAGRVRWDPVHSLWNGAMLAAALILGPLTYSPAALALFLVTTGAGLLLGHSVGFHRRLIHGSFACPLWLERILVWFGTIVGMSGPFWMIRTHDLRDWAQRQPACHDYLAHRRPMPLDAWWQIHCRLELERPPRFDLGRIGRDPFYRFLERTWMLQQAPIALLFFLIGGFGFVVWGVCARVAASVTGHWYIGHLAHRRGPPGWSTAPAFRPTTCHGPRSRPWARPGTTTIMPFPARRGSASIPARPIGASCSSGCWNVSASPGTCRRRRPCARHAA